MDWPGDPDNPLPIFLCYGCKSENLPRHRIRAVGAKFLFLFLWKQISSYALRNVTYMSLLRICFSQAVLMQEVILTQVLLLNPENLIFTSWYTLCGCQCESLHPLIWIPLKVLIWSGMPQCSSVGRRGHGPRNNWRRGILERVLGLMQGIWFFFLFCLDTDLETLETQMRAEMHTVAEQTKQI